MPCGALNNLNTLPWSYTETPSPSTGTACQTTSDRPTKPAPETIQARCPWCAITFTRRHDFKKHAREFHLSRSFWQCRGCGEQMGSERQAKLHPNRTRSIDCKNLGSAKVILHCDKRYFGCAHCAQCFDNAEAYLAHLAIDCSPQRAPRSAHQSLQVRALLQQPELLPHVRALSLRWRGDTEAYRKLWWTWNKTFMADIVERLEYGVQRHVDSQHPCIALHTMESFLQDMLAPSAGSILASEISNNHSTQAQNAPKEKPLPPLPTVEQPPTDVQYHQESVFQQARSFLQPADEYRPHLEPYPYPSTVEAWRLQQPHYDPTIGCSYSADFDAFGTFEWKDMADDINIVPGRSDHFDGGRFG